MLLTHRVGAHTMRDMSGLPRTGAMTNGNPAQALEAALDITAGLDRDEFIPYFQPIVELVSGRLAGFEILARWQHPHFGLILPDRFIPEAEFGGQIGRLMCQILEKAFRSAPAIPDPIFLAVNVSPHQLHDPILPSQISALAEASGFPLGRLHVEITESALVGNIEVAQMISRELKALGCRISMDDFGTGYSSLRHLQVLPIDKLKVDRTFVRLMTRERESRKIIAAILGLGHSLGMITVAEGVETEDQARMLQLLGCQLGQGWLYGKPQPAESIAGVLESVPKTPSSIFSSFDDTDIFTVFEAMPTERMAELKAIYDSAPIGLCYLDREFRHMSINSRMAKMNDATVEAHIGRSVQELRPDLFSRIEPYLVRALSGEAISRVDVWGPSEAPGKPARTVVWTCQPTSDEAGEVIGVLITALDVSEWKGIGFHMNEDSGSCACMAALGFQASQKQITSIFAKFAGIDQDGMLIPSADE